MIHVIGFGAPGGFELIIILIMTLAVFVLPVALLVWGIRAMIRNKKENVRMRLEVGKMADELEQVRKQAEGDQ